MTRIATLVFAAFIASASFAQSMWLVGPTQVAAINGKLDGLPSMLNYADGVMANLYKFDDSDEVFFGVDATFGPPPTRASTFVIVLNAVTKVDPPAFDHFEAFDFTTKSWIEIGATSPFGRRPAPTANPTLLSSSLETSRFAHPVTGEVWARAVWMSKGATMVYVDQLALMYQR